MPGKNSILRGQALKGTTAFVVRILFLAGTVLVLSGGAFGQAQPRQKGNRWISFPARLPARQGTAQRAAATPRERARGVRIAAPSAEEVRAETLLEGMYMTETTLADGQSYTSVVVPSAGRMEVGKPDLPAFGNWILIPNGTKMVLQVKPGKPVIYRDIAVPPVQPEPPDTKGLEALPFTKNLDTYSSDSDYPGVFAQAGPTQTMRGQECALLWVYPFQYNPVKQVLRVYPELTVTVRFAGKPKPIPARLKSKSFEKMMHRLAANADVVLEAEKEQDEAMGTDGDVMQKLNGSPTGCDYLIICKPDFETAANTLADWKNKSGFRTEVVTTGDTGTTVVSIKNYLVNAYNTWNPVPEYVLFFGDSGSIPTYETYSHWRRFDASHPQGRVGTDYLYATIGATDETPDIITGRLPVDDTDDAENCVNNIINYEKTPPASASFYSNVAVAGAFQDGSPGSAPNGYADRRFARTCENIRDYLTVQGYSVTRIYTTYNDFDNRRIDPNNWGNNFVFDGETGGAELPAYLKKPTFPWDGNATNISNAVNSGAFLVTHRDHGSRSGWGEPDFKKSNVDSLTNGTWLPVVWSINCMTGWFDNECDDGVCNTSDTSESFVESWLRNSNGGAVGVIAATRISKSGRNDRLVWGMMDAIWPNFIDSRLGGSSYPSAGNNDPVYRMGDVLNYGKTYMCTHYNPTVDHNDPSWLTVLMYHWFGDPTMEIWTAQPKTLSVSKPGFSSSHKYMDVRVKDSSNNPLEGARVTLYDPNAGWYSGTTNAEGRIRLSFSGPVTATFDLTVTLHNYKPYTGTVSINYTDSVYPSAPTYNNTEGQYLKAAPALMDIDFSDDQNLDEVDYKLDTTGHWYAIASGISTATYTTDWPLSVIAWLGLTQGNHYIYFNVIDDAANEKITANDTAAFHFVKDTVAPTEVSNLGSSSHSEWGYSNDNTIAVSWTPATDATSGVHGYSYVWSDSSSTDPDTTEDIGSGVTNLTSGPLEDGKWYFIIKASDSTVDLDGPLNPHWGDTEFAGPFYIDTNDPEVPTYNSSELQWFSSAPLLNIDFEDDRNLEVVSWKKKGASTWNPIFSTYNGAIYALDWDMSTSGWNGLSQGTNYIYFKVEDDAGNTYATSNDTDAFALIKDTTAPTVTYNSSESEYYGSSAPTLDIDFSDKVGTSDGKLDLIRYRFDDSGTWITIASNVNAATYTTDIPIDSVRWSGLNDNPHYIYFYIRDKAGNITETQNDTEAFEIIKDTQPPVANPAVTNTGIILEGDTVNFNGTGSTDASGIERYEWDFDNSDLIQIDSTSPTPTHIYNTWGSYTVTLTVYDPAGNSGTNTVVVQVKSRPVASIDSVKPAPSVAGQRITFVGSGSDADGDLIKEYNWRSSKDGQLSTNRIFNTNMLSPSDSTAHTIYFKVKDTDGIWSNETQFTLWVYVPKKWDMFKENDPRLSSQSNYPNIPYGKLNYAQGWNFPADSAITGSPVGANIDGKWTNGLEVAFASSAGTLYVLNSSGKQLWTASIGASASTPAIEDIDNDGKLDIVVGSSTGVYAYDANGTNIFIYADPCEVFDSSPAIADIDSNISNGKEIVIGCNDANVYAIDNSGSQLWAFSSPNGLPFTSSPAIKDIDPNSAGLETIIGGTDGTLYVLSSTGTQLASWTMPAPVFAIDTTPAVANLDVNWPGWEIVFGTDKGYEYCLNYNSSTQSLAVVWRFPSAGNPPLPAIDSSTAVGQVAEQGEMHIAFGCDDGNVYVLMADTGASMGSYSCGAGIQVNSTPAIANIDTVNFIGGPQGDLPEVIFGATNGNLYAVSYATGIQNLPWSPLALSAGQVLDSSPAVLDLNHDGELEILIGSANSRLYMIRAWSGFNPNPIAIVAPFQPGLVGHDLTLDASRSYDPCEETGSDYVAKFKWDINPPGYDPYETTDAVVTIPWSQLEMRGIYGDGDYPAQLTVYDSYDEASSPVMTTIAMRYTFDSPTADADGPYEIYVGNSVIFDANNSYADGPGNDIILYEWDLNDDGDFNDATVELVALSWQDLNNFGISGQGEYSVWLIVTDKFDQNSVPDEAILTILYNELPVVDADGPYEIKEGEPVTLNAMGYDPEEPNDYIVSYEWDINGDGVFGEYMGDNIIVPWAYLETACPGRGEDNPNPIRVRAYDTRGGYGTSESTNLYIYIDQPVAVAKANGSTDSISVIVGENVTFDHSESYHQWPSQRSITLYQWDFNGDDIYDWSTGSQAEQHIYAYPSDGLYQAKLKVTDNAMNIAFDTIEIDVSNYPPIAEADGPYSVSYSDTVILDGTASYDPDGTIIKYEWDLDNDSSYGDRVGETVLLTQVDLETLGLTNTGTPYPISLRVTDNQSATGTDSTTLTIYKENVVVSEPNGSAVYSDETAVIVSVTDDDGQSLAEQIAYAKTFYLEVDDGNDWQLLSDDILNSPNDTDQTLSFIFEIQEGSVDLEGGTYDMRVRFDGDSDYNSKIQTGTLSLDKEEVAISQPDASLVYGDSIAIQLTAEDNDAETLLHQLSLPKTVYLEANDGSGWLQIGQDTLSSGDNSDYILDYMIEAVPEGVNLPAGSYELRARFDGDSHYQPATSVGTLTITAKSTQLFDDIDLPADDWDWGVVYSDPVIIRLRLVDVNDANLLHQADEPKAVYVDVNSGSEWLAVAADSLSSIDDSDDTLEINCEIQEGQGDIPPGVWPIRLRFNGDSRYVSCMHAGSLTVEKEDTQLVDPGGDWQWSLALDDEMTIVVSLLDDDSEPLCHAAEEPKTVYADYNDSGAWVNFAAGQILGAGESDVSEDEDAVITFSWEQGLGSFEIRFRFEGDTYYNSTTSPAATMTVVPPPAVLHVPSEYDTIQDAIDAAADGDIVLVADGTYIGVDNKDLTWDGTSKHITVVSENGPSNCVIDCEQAGRGFVFDNTSQDGNDVVNGFTIKNGSAEYGGGIYCNGVSPSIINCAMTRNEATYGGGMADTGSSPTMVNCAFSGNVASTAGGGIHCSDYSNLTITNCTLSGNLARYGSGSIDQAGYWKFDEDGGAIAYDSANDNDGTISGATWTTGHSGSALYFHGGGQWASGSDSVTVPHSADIDITGPFTLAAWIKATGSDNYLMIIDKYYGSTTINKGYSFYLTGGRLRFSIYSYLNGNRDISGTLELRDNAWHHVAGVWDGNDIKIYVDGQPEGQNSWAYPPASTTNPLGIGKRLGGWGGYLPFLGTIDEVSIYDQALGPNDINDLFNDVDISGTGGGGGGGIYGSESELTITNCTFTDNWSGNGGAVYLLDSDTVITNSILWDDTPQEIYVASGSSPVVTYSDIKDDWSGDGNIDADPCFAEAGYWADANDPNVITEPNDPNAVWIDGDYHLLPTSPCIDAGDNDTVPADSVDINSDGDTTEQNPWDLDRHPRFVDDPGTDDTGEGSLPIIDMGADEFPYLGDLDFSGFVNFVDFALFAPYWLEGNCGMCEGADLTGSGYVDGADLQILAENWLAGLK